MSAHLDKSELAQIHTQFNAVGTQPSKKVQKTSKRITLRLSDDEHERLVTAAEGMTISAYVRKCMFGNKVSVRKTPTRAPVENERALATVLGKLGESRMANNLNQLAYQANCGSLMMDDQTEEEIRLACAHIAWMRVTLIEALGLKAEDQ